MSDNNQANKQIEKKGKIKKMKKRKKRKKKRVKKKIDNINKMKNMRKMKIILMYKLYEIEQVIHHNLKLLKKIKGENENTIWQGEIDCYNELGKNYKWMKKRKNLIQVGKEY
jgi:hypothetical protein